MVISFFKEWIGKLSGRRKEEEEAVPKSALDAWRIVHGSNDEQGQHLIARIRIRKPVIPRGLRYNTAVLIEWAYEGDPVSTLPDSETTDRMTEFERAIDPLASENGFAELVCVKTGLGARQWLYYTGDTARFMAEFNQLLAGHPPYPLEIMFNDDPDWSVWRGFLEDIQIYR